MAPWLDPSGRTICTSMISASRVPCSGRTRIGHAEQHVTHLAHDSAGMPIAWSSPWCSIAAHADLGHRVERVRHEDDRPTLALELAHAVQALGLEGLVAHREHLVDQEHVGLTCTATANPSRTSTTR